MNYEKMTTRRLLRLGTIVSRGYNAVAKKYFAIFRFGDSALVRIERCKPV